MLHTQKVFSYETYNFFTLAKPLSGLFKKKLCLLNEKEKVEITSETCHISGTGDTNYSAMKGKYYYTDCKNFEQYFYALLDPKAEIKEISMRTSAPHSVIYPHKDALSENNRKTCITWALAPIYTNCSPTVFYDESGIQIYKHCYDEAAFVLDTRITHSMENNEHERILLQVTFDSELKDLW
jgi:hypothetical protein